MLHSSLEHPGVRPLYHMLHRWVNPLTLTDINKMLERKKNFVINLILLECNILIWNKIYFQAFTSISNLQVIIRHLFLGLNIKEAIDYPRIHHQLHPMKVDMEVGFSKVKLMLIMRNLMKLYLSCIFSGNYKESSIVWSQCYFVWSLLWENYTNYWTYRNSKNTSYSCWSHYLYHYCKQW